MVLTRSKGKTPTSQESERNYKTPKPHDHHASKVMEERFTIALHNGGIFTSTMEYIGGDVHYWDRVDPDYMSYYELINMLKEVGVTHTSNHTFYFLVPGLDVRTRLVRVYYDAEVLEMCSVGLKHGTVDVFLVCDDEKGGCECVVDEGEVESTSDDNDLISSDSTEDNDDSCDENYVPENESVDSSSDSSDDEELRLVGGKSKHIKRRRGKDKSDEGTSQLCENVNLPSSTGCGSERGENGPKGSVMETDDTTEVIGSCVDSDMERDDRTEVIESYGDKMENVCAQGGTTEDMEEESDGDCAATSARVEDNEERTNEVKSVEDEVILVKFGIDNGDTRTVDKTKCSPLITEGLPANNDVLSSSDLGIVERITGNLEDPKDLCKLNTEEPTETFLNRREGNHVEENASITNEVEEVIGLVVRPNNIEVEEEMVSKKMVRRQNAVSHEDMPTCSENNDRIVDKKEIVCARGGVIEDMEEENDGGCAATNVSVKDNEGRTNEMKPVEDDEVPVSFGIDKGDACIVDETKSSEVVAKGSPANYDALGSSDLGMVVNITETYLSMREGNYVEECGSINNEVQEVTRQVNRLKSIVVKEVISEKMVQRQDAVSYKKTPARSENDDPIHESCEAGQKRRKAVVKGSLRLVMGDTRNPEPSKERRLSKRSDIMGMIFFCTSETKNDCYRYKVLGSPASKKNMVSKVYKGMRVFLFDVELRMMYGIYKADGPGGYNIEPRAFKSQFPSQVRFSVHEHCVPLAEESFRKVLGENYSSKSRFNCQLNSEQVKNLCKLFRKTSRKLEYSRVTGKNQREAATSSSAWRDRKRVEDRKRRANTSFEREQNKRRAHEDTRHTHMVIFERLCGQPIYKRERDMPSRTPSTLPQP